MARTARPEVLGGIGGFAGLFALDPGRFRRPGARLVHRRRGHQALVARATGRYGTVGIDLVAMCVDDLVCAGCRAPLRARLRGRRQARPRARRGRVVAGVAEGCRQAGCALLGGETAEHPGAMAPDDFDLAGFAVGAVARRSILGPDRVVRPATCWSAWPRPACGPTGTPWPATCCWNGPGARSTSRRGPGRRTRSADELLRPSVIYAPAVLAAGGRRGRPRRAPTSPAGGSPATWPGCSPRAATPWSSAGRWEVPRIFTEIERLGPVDADEMAAGLQPGPRHGAGVRPPARRRRRSRPCRAGAGRPGGRWSARVQGAWDRCGRGGA